jgi:hypothetical protein
MCVDVNIKSHYFCVFFLKGKENGENTGKNAQKNAKR